MFIMIDTLNLFLFSSQMVLLVPQSIVLQS